MQETTNEAGSPDAGRTRRATSILAIAGCALMIAVAGLVTANVLSRWLRGEEIPGVFELVQMGIALSVFSFLPYAQSRRANVVVDTFTTRLPKPLLRVVDALWDLVYAGAALLIAWRLAAGARDTIASGTTSMVLGLPTGWAIAAAAAMVAALGLVAIATAFSMLKGR